MFRKKKRWLLFFAMTLLPATGPVVTSLSKMALPSHPLIQASWPYLVYLLPLFLAGCVAYYSVITPMRKMEPVAKEFLDRMGENILRLGERYRISPRVNILLVFRKSGWLFMRKYFHIVWGLGMENQPDVKASFRTSKGVAGEVLKTGRPRLVDMELSHHEDWGFTEHEAKRFQPLTAIYSWPIYEVDDQGEQTGRIVGCVNLDALAQGACSTIEKNQARFDKLLLEFAEFASKIVS